MWRDGAGILDVGGESTRPGSDPVATEEEVRRVVPVVERLAGETDALLSVDTTKAEVARRALACGAHIINDVSALTSDEALCDVAGEYGAGVVLMHMQGAPRTMQENPAYTDVVREVCDYLAARCQALQDLGLDADSLCVDPGIGFGKTTDHNLALLKELDQLAALERPLLVGISRKSLIGQLTGRPVEDRLAGSLGVMAWAIEHGAHIIRVHDVKESCDVARVVDMLQAGEMQHVTMGTHKIAGAQ
jgi:dihydropteroate synthase